jgi:outer membrane protein TolC
MKRKLFYTLLVLLLPAWLMAQEKQPKYSLQQCLQQALEHFPTRKQLQLNQNQYQLQKSNLSKNYLPSLNLNGQASYQSDVTKVPSPPIAGFDMPVISKDWYKINFDLEQLIWDGGMTKNLKTLQTADYKISDQQVQIKFFTLKKQVDILYFNILFLQANLETLHLLVSDLNARIRDAEAALKNGMLLQADVDALIVNKKMAEQQIVEKSEDQKGLLASLSTLTHLKISSASELQVPEAHIASYSFVNHRPEYQLLDLQKSKLSALQKVTTAKRMPVLKLFGQAGYGRPGFDMLNPDFKDYYMAGVRLHWNIFDWHKVKHEKQILHIQSDILQTEKATFDQSLRADLEKLLAGIHKYEKLIQTDKDIVQLQQNVVKAADSKLKNGTITATNYLIELNKEMKAQLAMKAHKLQLLFAKYQYITAIGNL